MAKHKTVDVRQSVRRERTSKGRGKGWRGGWRDRIDVPRGAAEDFLLVPGTYPDRRPEEVEKNDGVEPHLAYYAFHQHKVLPAGRKYPWRTTCHEFHDGSPCVACLAKTEGSSQVDGRRRANQGKPSSFAINTLHLDLYTQVEATDKDGNVRCWERDIPDRDIKRGDPIMEWKKVEVIRDRKDILRNIEDLVDDEEVRQVKKGYLEVGKNHLACIEATDRKAAELCKCGGRLEIDYFYCATCEEPLLEMDDADMTREQVWEYEGKEQSCSECTERGFPRVGYLCSDCGDPVPYRWFEVVASLIKTGERAATIIEVKKVTPLDEYVLPDDTYLIEMTENDEGADVPVLDDDGDFIFVEDVKAYVENQFNFKQIFEPRSNDDIASWLGRPNPFRAATARRYEDIRKRAADKGSDDSDDSDDDTKSSRRRGKPARKSTKRRGRRA